MNKQELIKKIIEINTLTFQLALFIALNTLEEKDLSYIIDECLEGKRITPEEFEVFFSGRNEIQGCEDVIR